MPAVSNRWRSGRLLAGVLVCVAAAVTLSCGYLHRSEVTSFVEEPFPRKLSEWHLFLEQKPHLRPNARVIPYDLNTPLFSDYASKYRFVWMPQGTSAAYREDGVFEFPVGTILAKSFAFPTESDSHRERLIETRLLVRGKSAWMALPYIWNEAQTEAVLDVAPDPVHVRYREASGAQHDFTYFIPNANECKQCHENSRVLLPIGPKARNLNKDFAYEDGVENQLGRWARVGYLRGAPANPPRVAQWDAASGGPVEARAKAYLDNNCAHCHQPGGTAGYTGIDFRANVHEALALGICKSPNSAGRVGNLTYDLVPGHPNESILLARMQSIRPKEMMPQIGRSVVHEEGVKLISQWIQEMDASSRCAR